MPVWTMKITNPEEIHDIEEIKINIAQDNEGKRAIREGDQIVAGIENADNTIIKHCFKIIRIDQKKRYCEIVHLYPVFQKFELTPEKIWEIDQLISDLVRIEPQSIAQYCYNCGCCYIPLDFSDLVLCPFCKKPYLPSS